MTAGSITLADVAAKAPTLGITCNRCERTGRYRLETLIAKHGKGFGIPALLELLSADCPHRKSMLTYDLCGVHSPELSQLFLRARR